jgi:hypothetical protein
MTDYNEIRRQQDYRETETQCLELLCKVKSAIAAHQSKPCDWSPNSTMLTVKQNLIDTLNTLTPKPGAKEVNDALTGLAETVKEIRKEEKQ